MAIGFFAAKLVGNILGDKIDHKYFGGRAGKTIELTNQAIFYARLLKAIRTVKNSNGKSAAEKIAEELKGAVPVDTGKLRESVRVVTDEGGSRVIEGGTADTLKRLKSGGEFDQALAVEYGTQKMPAQPHYWPTMRSNEKAIESSLRDAIEEEFE